MDEAVLPHRDRQRLNASRRAGSSDLACLHRYVDLVQRQRDRHAFQLRPRYPKRDVIAPGRRQSKPRRQFEKLCKHIFVQLKVGQLPLALEGRYIYLITREVLRVPKNKFRINYGR